MTQSQTFPSVINTTCSRCRSHYGQSRFEGTGKQTPAPEGKKWMLAIFECKNLGSILEICDPLSLQHWSLGGLAHLVTSGCRKINALHVNNLQNYRIQGLCGTVVGKAAECQAAV